MADLPTYLDVTLNSDTILQTMLSQVPSDIDTSEGGFMWDALAPAAIQMALGAWMAQQVLNAGFAQTTYGSYLDLKVAEAGLTRLAAVAGVGQVTFTGTVGTVIPAGSRVSTVGTTNVPALYFDTTANATIGAGGTVSVNVIAEVAGVAGNVLAGTVTLLGGYMAGITAVTNPAATTGAQTRSRTPHYWLDSSRSDEIRRQVGMWPTTLLGPVRWKASAACLSFRFGTGLVQYPLPSSTRTSCRLGKLWSIQSKTTSHHRGLIRSTRKTWFKVG